VAFPLAFLFCCIWTRSVTAVNESADECPKDSTARSSSREPI
jgi:hypothetical protein